jgi:site-specific recombinase XerD
MFFHHKGVNLNNITRQDVAQLIDYRRKNNFDSLAIDKMFFRYLYKNKFIQTDFTGLFKNVKPLQSVKPIQYYSELEIEQIENSIDRTTAFGKQDYAVILLASRLGLRASDIAELSFSDINWLKCEIRKVQYKTQRTVVLPLLEDVGNALLDYIKNARPQVENQRVFITIHHPHRAFLSSRVSNIVRKVVQGSGVVTKGRPKGSHSLRHSLATNLISKGTGLPVLSDILGHSTTESTKVYLGISLQSLLECSLDVPLVNENFFKQKGGYFYG